MSEENVINKTQKPITVDTLVLDFMKIGLNKGDTVLVHSSLSAIGWVCGEERAVIEALIRCVGCEGTICMPAHSGGNSDPAKWCNPPVPEEWIESIYQNMPPFDPFITPTRGIGRIAEVFRTYPGTLRSNHPQTSFCAKGKNAKKITEKHELTPQFGKNSPLGILYELNAKVLFLGTGYGTCTCFHMGEALCGKIPRTKLGAAMNTTNGREWVWFEDYLYDCDDFEILGKEFELNYEVTNGKIGNADSKLFCIRPAIEFSIEWMKKNRNEIV